MRMVRAATSMAVLAMLGAGCVSPEPGADTGATGSTAVAVATTQRVPSPEDPLRVVFAGDSVMAGLVPPLEAAFEERGAAVGRFVLTPSILRDPAVRFTWERQIEAFDPEVVVVLMGTWEAMIVEGSEGSEGSLGTPGSPEWLAAYRDELLVPWVDLLAAGGASIIWVGMPPVVEGAVAARIPALNAAFEALAAERDDLAYVDPGVLAGPDGGLAEVRTIDGVETRLRQVDGLHLCPGGAALLAEPVLALLEADHAIAFGDRWRTGDWPADEISPGTPTYPAVDCPAPAAAG